MGLDERRGVVLRAKTKKANLSQLAPPNFDRLDQLTAWTAQLLSPRSLKRTSAAFWVCSTVKHSKIQSAGSYQWSSSLCRQGLLLMQLTSAAGNSKGHPYLCLLLWWLSNTADQGFRLLFRVAKDCKIRSNTPVLRGVHDWLFPGLVLTQ